MKVPLQVPTLDTNEVEAVSKVIQSGWITQGERVNEFEKVFADYTGAKHGIAVSNCSVALFLVLKALGLGKGDEVITTAYSFIATANAIYHAGCKPIFIDVELDTYNINYKGIEDKVTKRTKAILTVDNVGYPVRYDKIKKIASEHKLAFVSDSACAVGSSYKNEKIGSQADMHCFSFHPRKVITTGEGGMITTNNDELANKMRILKSHGFSISDFERHKANQVSFEEYPYNGFNFRMTDMQAAIGLCQMVKLEWVLIRRKTIAEMYSNAFRHQKNLIVPYNKDSNAFFNYQSYQLRVKDLDRDEIMKKLFDKGVFTRRGNQALHKQKCFTKYSKLSFPVTEEVADTSVILPLFPQMTNDQINYVIENVLEICK